MKPSVFFDRDGVVNVSPGEGYVTRWEDFVLCPGIEQALCVCAAKGFLAILVTSQRCVGKGLISEQKLDEIHSNMQSILAKTNGTGFDGIYAFTGLPGTKSWEKPKPGMIEAAAREHRVDLEKSWLVGDHDRDITMAMNAGVPRTIRVRSHHPVRVPATHTIDATSDLADLLERELPVIC
jgi:D-glycero-D-manno-heptose 1,7-bisphosphate phosphatase